MAHPSIPASIILSPRELKQYKKWQFLHTSTKPAEKGYIPTAHEYEDFQQWLKRQDSGYFSDIFEDISSHLASSRSDAPTRRLDTPVASVCQHAMHPVAAGRLQARCPVCIVEIHMRYMQVLVRALANAGGHAPSCTLTSSDHQETVYIAWRNGKLSTLRELSQLETMAEEEVVWSARHPDAKHHEDIHTAKTAVDRYWDETVGSCLEGCTPPKKGKAVAVAFAQGTDFSAGRPNAYFHRRSPRYEPGKYTVQDPEEDEDEDEDAEEEPSQQAQVHVRGMAQSQSHLDLEEEDEEEEDDDDDEPIDDDGDPDWEDVESEDEDMDDDDDDEDDDSEGCDSYIEFEETSFIVFG